MMTIARTPTLGSPIGRQQSAVTQLRSLVLLSLTPALHAIERRRLQNQLKWTARNVELLEKQIENDRKAIKSEQDKQAAINSRLAELG